jgi:hypothetical protein
MLYGTLLAHIAAVHHTPLAMLQHTMVRLGIVLMQMAEMLETPQVKGHSGH